MDRAPTVKRIHGLPDPWHNISMRLALYLVLLGACGDDDAAPPRADASPPPMGFARAPSRVDVFTNEAAGETWTDAAVVLMAEAEPDAYRVDAEEGSCRRLVAVEAFCDPPCLTGVCLAGGTCEPWPTARSAGDVTIAGGAVSRTLVPPSYVVSELGLVFPAGEEVSASAQGADYPGFRVAATMSPPFDPTPAGITLVRGEPVTITWAPADPEARVRLQLIADRGHALVHPSVIECDVADGDGTITVPQAMIDAHADPANWSCGDCFSSWATRYRAARTTTTSGDVDLWVGSRRSLYAVP